MHRRCVLALLLAGCAPAPKPAKVAPLAPPPPSAVPNENLAPSARFRDLVEAASALEGREQAAGCLLARGPSGFTLRAELAPAVRPLPMPAADLEPLLEGSERVELLSAWGRYGDGSAKLALAGFTLAAPARDALALLVTDRGVSVRGASGTGLAPRDALDVAAAVAAIAQQPEALVFVAAEEALPVASLAALLEALARAQREVVLAVNLAPGTTLPAPPPSARLERCEQGLPPTREPEGELPLDRLRAGVQALTAQAPDCLSRGDARGAAGGRLVLALRITADGSVQQACLVRDELDDDAVASCVIDLARKLTFAAPSPSGVLDVELPVALRPGSRVVQAPLCAE